MAISITEQVDFLWKKIIYGVSKSAAAGSKLASNETVASYVPVVPSHIWGNGDSIPQTPPTVTTSDVELKTAAARVRMTSDPTSPANVAWHATSTYGDLSTRQGDFIPASFGSGYAAQAYVGDPNAGPAARIFPDTTGQEFVFDYAAGVLVFEGAIPANLTATVGSGTVSVSTDGVYIQAYRYVGPKGATGGGTLGTIATQDADAVNITGGTLDGVTLTNCTIDGGTF